MKLLTKPLQQSSGPTNRTLTVTRLSFKGGVMEAI